MDRRDSFSSCVSDSDGDSVCGSYSSLSTLSTGGQHVRPSTPQSRDLLHRRSGVKRQAPKPPTRPPATGSPSPVTTVHLQFEPVVQPPSGSPACEQTRKITKIISEPVMTDPILPAVSSAIGQVGHLEGAIFKVPSQPVPSSQALSPGQPVSPLHITEPNQPVGQSELVTNGSRFVDPVTFRNRSMSPPPQAVLSSRPMSPTRPMSPIRRPMSPSGSMPPPRSIPTTMAVMDSQMVSHSGLIAGQNLSRSPSVYHHGQVISPRSEMVTPAMVTPAAAAHHSQRPLITPQAPQRSGSSQMATKNLSNLRIRLIDEESDSEAYQSDATEELRGEFQEGIIYQYPQPIPIPPMRRTSGGDGVAGGVYPSSQQQYVLATEPTKMPVRPHDAITHQENYDYYSSFDESSQSEVGPETPETGVVANPTVVVRGRARRLTHSASDPGVSRGQRVILVQHPRPPGIAVPPPLDQLSEEDVAPSDYEDKRQEDEIVGPGLKRTDSMVTVAHLYEDVLVSSRLRIRVTLTNLTVVVVVAALVLPNTAIMLYTIFRLVFGTLFPAYYSYKAVKTKNVKEYVKWMMYWIVFAFFTCFETFTDLFLSFWFPFYYELKILVVLWLLSPATRGSSILYRKFVHPWLTRREDDIDNCIAQAKQQGYSTVIQLGTKGVNYATTVLMQTAIKASQGNQGGGGLVSQLRRSYSSGELSDGDMNRNVKALPHIPDDNYDERAHHSSGPYDSETRIRAESDAAYRSRGSSVNRGVRSNKTRSADVTDYYQDPDEAVQRRRSPRTQDTASHVLSADDLTSGYSSGDPDAGDLIYDLRHDPNPNNNLEIISEPKKSSKVRRTQSLSASTLNNHRSHRVLTRRGEAREGLRSGSAGRGSGPVDDLVAPASYSSSGHPAASHHGSSFKRSRPGEISAYATLPRTGNKRTAAKKRQV